MLRSLLRPCEAAWKTQLPSPLLGTTLMCAGGETATLTFFRSRFSGLSSALFFWDCPSAPIHSFILVFTILGFIMIYPIEWEEHLVKNGLYLPASTQMHPPRSVCERNLSSLQKLKKKFLCFGIPLRIPCGISNISNIKNLTLNMLKGFTGMLRFAGCCPL